jgi:ATP synthase protein I
MARADKTSGREVSGRDQDGIRRRLVTLGERLAEAKARGAAPPRPEPKARNEALGYALRLGVELVAGVAVGGFIGWALDRWLGTAPFLMVVFLALGAAAGIFNVIRAAKAMQAKAAPIGNDLPEDVDDEN